ncbi:hypothetical protein Psfp_00518 [Pelotomaculum sp. FP]|uniref:hypothetical protein n=1 Tax=Pelotomaculum sp. FP TaxID=261474 RepID=UPI001066AA7B|nr:hypothetical protein [Pelotomaculum sp. FP]TEB17294.1 hypothetical protein Psfp_00518 [Pelotomaculum sp. FP]
MAATGKSEAAKWGWLSIAVTVLGVAIISAPWIPDKYKIMLAVPVYAMFFYVYYKYLHLKKMAKANTGAVQDNENRAARRQAERRQKGKNKLH